jgi:threonine dehydrogenase-like Zn-dependent dehydrogenase
VADGPSRAARLVAPRRFDIVRERIDPPAAGRILVRILACGVCASELHTWQDGVDAYPIRIGHEPVGVVEAVGSSVEGVEPGQAVTGGFGPSFADRVTVDPGVLVAVPDGVSAEELIGEPLGCVMEARRRTPLTPGDRVALVGAGYMGLLMLQVLGITGSGETVIIDPRTDALRRGLEIGATEAWIPTELPGSGVDDAFDVVIEASGTQEGLDLATRLVRQHGTVTILGYHQSRRSVDLQAWNWKAIDVINGHVRRRDLLNESIRRGLEFVRLGRIAPGGLITHRFELEDVGKAFEALESKPAGFVKAVVVMGES